MVSLITPKQAQLKIAAHMRQQRLAFKFKQTDLAQRSGVALASLRKFERTGIISLGSFLKIAVILGVLDQIVSAVEISENHFTMDQMISQMKTKPRKRAR